MPDDQFRGALRDLPAHVSLEAQVLDLVKLNVGADVSLGEVNLRVAGVRAQAMLKVRLDNVSTIVGDVVQLLDRHPEIITSLTGGLGDALREVGSGVGSAVHEIGSGAGDAVREIGGGLGGALDPRRDIQGRHVVAYEEPPTALTAEPPAESVVVAEVVPDAPRAAPPDAASEPPAG